MLKWLASIGLIFALSVSISVAQEKTVTGVVTEESGITIPGATIMEMGTSNGTTSDMDGNYTIKVSDAATAVLKYSFIGYAPQEIAVAGRATITLPWRLV